MPDYDGTYSENGATTTPIQNENTTNKRQQTKYTCSLCHGKRRIVKIPTLRCMGQKIIK